eukprot:scaffold6649_cov65-Cylindrotheca_fusiformis.AAC.4
MAILASSKNDKKNELNHASDDVYRALSLSLYDDECQLSASFVIILPYYKIIIKRLKKRKKENIIMRIQSVTTTTISTLAALCLSLSTVQGLSQSNHKNHHHPKNNSNRRHCLQQLFWIGSSSVVGTLLPLPIAPITAANAEYGVDAKLSFPDVIQGMNDRATKQCLVESLGNRECLVYREDAEKLLYKGADVNILIQRVQTSTDALDKIPTLVEKKQWNAITGILTGSLGELSSSLTMLSKLASNNNNNLAKEKAQIVKQDLFAMGTATTNKQAEAVLKYQKKALEDLAIFLSSL